MSVPQMSARDELDAYEQLKAKILRHLKDKNSMTRFSSW